MSHLPPLVLASASPYRAELLRRLGLPFETVPADVDENPQPGEGPTALSLRLAMDKAQAVRQRHPEATVIGSDQVASLDGAALGKPGDHAQAVEQLRRASGKTMSFFTSLCVLAPHAEPQTDTDTTEVHFRQLEDAEIQAYLKAEQPYDCAGSFRAEGLGVVLFRRLSCDDPTALIGLPLIRLSGMLRRLGYPLPG